MFKIADFGKANSKEASRAISSQVLSRQKLMYTTAYLTPELIPDNLSQQLQHHPTTYSDIHAFRMLMYEVIFSDRNPWNTSISHLQIFEAVRSNVRPESPGIEQHISDESDAEVLEKLISIMKQCWDQDLEVRPSLNLIADILKDCKVILYNEMENQAVDQEDEDFCCERNESASPPLFNSFIGTDVRETEDIEKQIGDEIDPMNFTPPMFDNPFDSQHSSDDGGVVTPNGSS